MTENAEHNSEIRETMALTAQLANWFRTAGVEQADLSVDLADAIAAARHTDRIVRQMLALNPNEPEEAAQALRHLGKMYAWLFTELKPHLEVLEQAWPALEQRLDELAPPDEE